MKVGSRLNVSITSTFDDGESHECILEPREPPPEAAAAPKKKSRQLKKKVTFTDEETNECEVESESKESTPQATNKKNVIFSSARAHECASAKKEATSDAMTTSDRPTLNSGSSFSTPTTKAAPSSHKHPTESLTDAPRNPQGSPTKPQAVFENDEPPTSTLPSSLPAILSDSSENPSTAGHTAALTLTPFFPAAAPTKAESHDEVLPVVPSSHNKDTPQTTNTPLNAGPPVTPGSSFETLTTTAETSSEPPTTGDPDVTHGSPKSQSPTTAKGPTTGGPSTSPTKSKDQVEVVNLVPSAGKKNAATETPTAAGPTVATEKTSETFTNAANRTVSPPKEDQSTASPPKERSNHKVVKVLSPAHKADAPPKRNTADETPKAAGPIVTPGNSLQMTTSTAAPSSEAPAARGETNSSAVHRSPPNPSTKANRQDKDAKAAPSTGKNGASKATTCAETATTAEPTVTPRNSSETSTTAAAALQTGSPTSDGQTGAGPTVACGRTPAPPSKKAKMQQKASEAIPSPSKNDASDEMARRFVKRGSDEVVISAVNSLQNEHLNLCDQIDAMHKSQKSLEENQNDLERNQNAMQKSHNAVVKAIASLNNKQLSLCGRVDAISKELDDSHHKLTPTHANLVGVPASNKARESAKVLASNPHAHKKERQNSNNVSFLSTSVPFIPFSEASALCSECLDFIMAIECNAGRADQPQKLLLMALGCKVIDPNLQPMEMDVLMEYCGDFLKVIKSTVEEGSDDWAPPDDVDEVRVAAWAKVCLLVEMMENDYIGPDGYISQCGKKIGRFRKVLHESKRAMRAEWATKKLIKKNKFEPLYAIKLAEANKAMEDLKSKEDGLAALILKAVVATDPDNIPPGLIKKAAAPQVVQAVDTVLSFQNCIQDMDTIATKSDLSNVAEEMIKALEVQHKVEMSIVETAKESLERENEILKKAVEEAKATIEAFRKHANEKDEVLIKGIHFVSGAVKTFGDTVQSLKQPPIADIESLPSP